MKQKLRQFRRSTSRPESLELVGFVHLNQQLESDVALSPKT